jgi:hypothetical protein
MSLATAGCASKAAATKPTAADRAEETILDAVIPERRPAGALLTEESAGWAVTSSTVARYLRARGVQQCDVDDLVQEVALRVLTARPGPDPEKVLPWCLVVARNLSVDLARSRSRNLCVADVPETAGPCDVEHEVVQRAELHKVLAALQVLAPADRAAIWDGVNEVPAPPDRKTAVRLAVRRHRARQRLAGAVACALGWLLWPVRRARQLSPAAALAPLALAAAVGQLPSQTVAPDDVPAARPAVSQQAPTPVAARPGDPGRGPQQAQQVLPEAATSPVRRSVRRDPPTEQVVSVQLPSGDGLSVHTEDDATERPRGSVCVAGLPVVPDSCLNAPSSHGAAETPLNAEAL